MKTTTSFLSMALLFSLAQTFAYAAPAADDCRGFSITSPVETGLKWTSGECYQVSYDLADNAVGNSTVSVDLYAVHNKTKILSLATNETTNAANAIKPFNLFVPKTGDYYYLVTFISGGNCPPKKSVTFNVEVSPNSPPGKCS